MDYQRLKVSMYLFPIFFLHSFLLARAADWVFAGKLRTKDENVLMAWKNTRYFLLI